MTLLQLLSAGERRECSGSQVIKERLRAIESGIVFYFLVGANLDRCTTSTQICRNTNP